ncbi:hypothetical protein CAEBREN_12997 [Caenorhabditis brenneri]|uniref:Reverse transcriptase domain-containing protein n=1 Tax=Caenorhabditis brenneri TaxID=135651 RepID=G0MPF5_CAEBE|nr:hypothetical protein CAEBREN_12997 [Caenorhabditis brenneri]
MMFRFRSHKWLNAFVSNRTFQVIVNGKLSTSKAVTSGVPQGSVLGPTLFLMYINDIGDGLKCDHLLFADDLKLFATKTKDIEDDMRVLENWCTKWQMQVAPNKCEHIMFKKGKTIIPSSITFKLDNSIIPVANYVRDLGVHLSSDLTFLHHYNLIIRKAHQRINIFFNVLKHASFGTLLSCFKIYIIPLLEYGSIIFSPTIKQQIILLESVQKSFVFRLFKKFGKTYLSYFDALMECGLESLEYRRLVINLHFTYKYVVSKEIIIDHQLFVLENNDRSLRRHEYILRSPIRNSTKITNQLYSNRIIRCWNSLPRSVFPVKVSFPVFKSNLLACNLSHFLTLNPCNY